MKRTTLLVSSVQKELAEERRAIRDFVRNDPLLRRFFDVWPDQQGLSPTEREFDRATAKGKPRLIFIKGANDKGRHPKMAALIRKAGVQLVRRRFADVTDLTAAVYASLVAHLEQTGGVRTKPFDAAACPDAKLSDLSREKITEFLTRAQAERGYPLGPKTPMNKALAHLNLLDGDKPSHAAILLFGKKPQRFLITSEVKCMHFHGHEVHKPIPSYHIYKGTVFELVDQAFDFVMAKLNRAVIPSDVKVASDVEYELPWKAVREAIVNAVTHRNYTSNASVQVMLFADRLEVWNPGELPPPLTLATLRKPHASIPHNPLIAEPMFLAAYAEKAGSGILDMMKLCKQAGIKEPAFREDGGQFVQTIWRPKAAAITQITAQITAQVGTKSALSRHQVEILHKCLAESTLLSLMIITGRTDRTKFRHQVLNPILNMGLIEMTVPGKPRSSNQKYRLADKGRKHLAEKQS